MPDFRRVLVRRVDGHYFDSVAAATAIHKRTPGALWGREFVHQSGVELFTIDNDNRCNACRNGATCKTVRIGLVDLRTAKAQKHRAVEDRLYREELDKLYGAMPEKLHNLIGYATITIFDEVAHHCGGEMPDIDAGTPEKAREIFESANSELEFALPERFRHRPLERESPKQQKARKELTLPDVMKARYPEELAALATTAKTRSKAIPEPAGLPPAYVIREPSTYLDDCKAGCAGALAQLPIALDYCFDNGWPEAAPEVRAKTKALLMRNWKNLCDAWMRGAERKLRDMS